jgi:hypothetical protein
MAALEVDMYKKKVIEATLTGQGTTAKVKSDGKIKKTRPLIL